jgi:peptidoglycan hydrolase CwlO-like protein
VELISSAGAVLTVVALLISVPASAAAAFFIARGVKYATQMAELRKDNEDLRSRVNDRDKHIDELEEKFDKASADIELIKIENAKVWEQITQRADVEGVKVLLGRVIQLLEEKA